jgi:hypothetical protein
MGCRRSHAEENLPARSPDPGRSTLFSLAAIEFSAAPGREATRPAELPGRVGSWAEWRPVSGSDGDQVPLRFGVHRKLGALGNLAAVPKAEPDHESHDGGQGECGDPGPKGDQPELGEGVGLE